MRWQSFIFEAELVSVATASTTCGGHTKLVPSYQIGRLSCRAVVANDAGVRVMVRTAAWPDPQFDFEGIYPIEVTFDNASSQPLRVSQQRITFVTDGGERISVIPPGDVAQASRSELDKRYA
jgi:hypothetical protein